MCVHACVRVVVCGKRWGGVGGGRTHLTGSVNSGARGSFVKGRKTAHREDEGHSAVEKKT